MMETSGTKLGGVQVEGHLRRNAVLRGDVLSPHNGKHHCQGGWRPLKISSTCVEYCIR